MCAVNANIKASFNQKPVYYMCEFDNMGHTDKDDVKLLYKILFCTTSYTKV